MSVPFVIGVAGGSCSGKKSVCDYIVNNLQPCIPKDSILVLKQEDFYRVWTEEEEGLIKEGNFNFDHPDSFDFDLLVRTVTELKKGKVVSIPHFDRILKKRAGEATLVQNIPKVVLVEGILVLYEKRLIDLVDIKIFVDVDSDVRLSRRVLRDTQKSQITLEECLKLYLRFVKPSFDEFVLPTKKQADIIVPRGVDNECRNLFNSLAALLFLQSHINDLISPNVTSFSETFKRIKP